MGDADKLWRRLKDQLLGLALLFVEVPVIRKWHLLPQKYFVSVFLEFYTQHKQHYTLEISAPYPSL